MGYGESPLLDQAATMNGKDIAVFNSRSGGREGDGKDWKRENTLGKEKGWDRIQLG